jgi:uncharacterized protein YndB with AHSA1/START domain
MLSTETQTIELDVAPAIVFDILADPRRIPEWASAFADRVSEDPPHGWQVTKGDDRFAIRMVAFSQTRHGRLPASDSAWTRGRGLHQGLAEVD